MIGCAKLVLSDGRAGDPSPHPRGRSDLLTGTFAPLGAGGGKKVAKLALLRRLRADPVWSSVSAVKTGRVHLVPTDLIGQPTPRVVEGVRLLARYFHPELFDHDADTD